jgi:hypothetical protein
MQNSKGWSSKSTGQSGLAVLGPYNLLLIAVFKLGWEVKWGQEGGAGGHQNVLAASIQLPPHLQAPFRGDKPAILPVRGEIWTQALRMLFNHIFVIDNHFLNFPQKL